MRQEVFEIVQKMDKDNIRTQMALQCAPLITGLKVANLLIIPSKNEEFVGAILDGTDISYMRLAKSDNIFPVSGSKLNCLAYES